MPRKASHKGHGLRFNIDGGGQGKVRPGVLETGGQEFGGVQQRLARIFSPGGLHQGGQLREVAPEILDG